MRTRLTIAVLATCAAAPAPAPALAASGGDRLGYTRMIAVDADGKNPKPLSARDSGNATERVFGGGSVWTVPADDVEPAAGAVMRKGRPFAGRPLYVDAPRQSRVGRRWSDVGRSR